MAQYLGLALLIAWAANIWAFLSVLEARPGLFRVVIWAAVLLVPVLGLLAWAAFGPRATSRS